MHHLSLDDLPDPHQVRLLGTPLRQKLDSVADRSQRIAQFVSQHRQELVLPLIRLRQFFDMVTLRFLQSPEPLLTLPQRLLRVLALCDIGTDADRPPASRPERLQMDILGEPADRAVGPAATVLLAVVPAGPRPAVAILVHLRLVFRKAAFIPRLDIREPGWDLDRKEALRCFLIGDPQLPMETWSAAIFDLSVPEDAPGAGRDDPQPLQHLLVLVKGSLCLGFSLLGLAPGRVQRAAQEARPRAQENEQREQAHVGSDRAGLRRRQGMGEEPTSGRAQQSGKQPRTKAAIPCADQHGQAERQVPAGSSPLQWQQPGNRRCERHQELGDT
jgi:hypothetical protein